MQKKPLYLAGIRGGAQGGRQGRQLGHPMRPARRNSEPRSERGQIVECDEVYLPSGAGDERSLFFFVLISECVFPRAELYRTAGWLVGWLVARSLLRCGGRSSCQKRCSSEQKSFLPVDTDVPLRRTRNAKRPRTGQDREWSGERKTLWLWSRGAGTPSLRQMLLVTIDLRKLHERQPV